VEDLARQAGNDGEGGLWFTIKQAAAFTGRRIETIYSWERRGILTDPKHDEYGRRIYSQQQISEAEKKVRPRAQRILRRAA
jgi:DNA-binding transcriptional MerR regulator